MPVWSSPNSMTAESAQLAVAANPMAILGFRSGLRCFTLCPPSSDIYINISEVFKWFNGFVRKYGVLAIPTENKYNDCD